MNNPSFSHTESWGRRFDGSFAATKARQSIVERKSRVPLDKSCFGRENPRKSKEIQPQKPGVFRSGTGRPKKTQTGSTNGVAPAVKNEPNRLNAEAVD